MGKWAIWTPILQVSEYRLQQGAEALEGALAVAELFRRYPVTDQEEEWLEHPPWMPRVESLRATSISCLSLGAQGEGERIKALGAKRTAVGAEEEAARS